jgi:hypothetical protein
LAAGDGTGYKPSPLLFKAPADVDGVVDRIMITTNAFSDQKIIKVLCRLGDCPPTVCA